MSKKVELTPEQQYANRRARQELYRHRIHRFTFQFSLKDTEAFEWFEKQTDKGKYLKNLILADKEKQTMQCDITGDLYTLNEMEVKDMSIDYNTLLYEKMKAEQEQYRDWLLTQEPAEMLNHTYEYTMREDIVICMKDLKLSAKQAKALLKSPCPLNDVYKEFKDREVEHMDTIRDSIETRADQVIKREAARESR